VTFFHRHCGVCIGLSLVVLMSVAGVRGEPLDPPAPAGVLTRAAFLSLDPPDPDKPESDEPKSETEQDNEQNESQPDPNKAKSDESEKADEKSDSDVSATTAEAKEETPATAPTTQEEEEEEEEDESNTPQVEVYIPSVTALVDAAKRSKTAAFYKVVVGLIPPIEDETEEGLDIGAVATLLEEVSGWPDTSVIVTTYTQDREGRARWAIRIDWPIEEFRERLASLLKLEAAGKVLKDVELHQEDDEGWRIRLPDHVLAVLVASGDGTLIASTPELQPPETVFGLEAPDGGTTSEKTSASKKAVKKKKKKSSLIYCRLNLAGGDEDDGDSFFSTISGVKDIRYGASLRKNGLWSEKFIVRWNPALGMFLKTALKKLKKPFECPRESYVTAAFNASLGGGMADVLAGLEPGTIGTRASAEMAFSAVPGTGFLPFPDLFYQFNINSKERIIDAIREAIEEDAKEREEEDREMAWHEEEIDGGVVFWRDPSAGVSHGIMPVTYRPVIFFEEPCSDDASDSLRLIIAQTTMWADDAVNNWQRLTKTRKSRVAIPGTKKAHWQARISWDRLYNLGHPYLSMLASLSQDATLPPTAEELGDALADAVINIRIEFAGVQARHTGPIPFGAAYVPLVTYTSLGDTADPSSEASRERIACRHLRVLYHHAELFQEDYGRWPATVAELDGYVDFATHKYLLWLRPQDRGFTADLVSLLTGKEETEDDDEDIDDSLYVIEWSPDDWRLMFRDDEFKNYRTIYIDKEGEIHRVPKPDEAAATDGPMDELDDEEDKKAA